MTEQLPLFSPPGPNDKSRPAGQPPASTLPATSPALNSGASLNAAIMAWRDHLEKERSPANTVKAFIGDLNLAAQFVGAFKNVGQVTTRDLDNWLTWQRTNQKCSPKTYSRRVTSLKSFFCWLHESGVHATDPAAPVM